MSAYQDYPQPRRRGCLSRLVGLVLIGALVFGALRMVGVTMDDLGWFKNRVVAEAESFLREGDFAGPSGEPGSGGEGYTFSVLQPDGVSPVTWPCVGTIPIIVNPEGAPEGFAELLEGAVSRVNAASGFTLEVVGETSDRDFLERGAGDVLLGFADADEVDSLSGQTAGVGGVVYVSSSDGGERTAVGGMVVLDTDAFDGSMSDATAQAIVMHELAHVLGLGHTDARGQLMRETNTFQVDFGDGDEAGLAHLREYACS